MKLTEKLKDDVLNPLGVHGWTQFFAEHGLDISVPLDQLDEELSRPLKIARSAPGLEEFSLTGIRGIEPGSPARSLLYHALASPCCVKQMDGATIGAFPTLAQLDVVENYVYSRSKLVLSKLKDPVLAVFAYQYRDQMRTTHRQHADIVFSRTGVARVGTHAALYDGASRGYLVNPGDRERGFRVLPARYALFIAERRVRGATGAVLRSSPLDSELTFLFPVHKVFEGDECLFTENALGELQAVRVGPIAYIEQHVNEKLARIHDPQSGENDCFVPPHTEIAFDRTVYPFIRRSSVDSSMLHIEIVGDSCQVSPVPSPLVSVAKQVVKGKEELVRFQVPGLRTIRGRNNRYWSTLELTARGNSRAAPEYLNIRQEVPLDGGELVDLNYLSSDDFQKKVLVDGGYDAAHFIDHTCDGALSVKMPIGIDLPMHCAFSLVTAVDYFPLVDQVEVQEWIEWQQRTSAGLANVELLFPQGGPAPLSDGRFVWDMDSDARGTQLTYQLPNCNLADPSSSTLKAFGLDDSSSYTVTAIVGSPGAGRSLRVLDRPRRTLSWLPDAAANVFAPGWDVSQHQRDGRNMMVSYGLGSPFPEDAKLCAALNSFWPSVAPDSSRTYGFRPPKENAARRLLFTSVPLTDFEIGYHPKHPRVLANEVASMAGWDGDYGPYRGNDKNGDYICASNPLRADLTRASLEGKPRFAGMDCITTEEFISRIYALNWCRQNCEAWCLLKFGVVFNHRQSGWWLVSYETVADWASWSSTVHKKANTSLTGNGCIFVFARVGDPVDLDSPPMRMRFPIQERFEIQLCNLAYFQPFAAPGTPEPGVFLRRNDESFEQLPG